MSKTVAILILCGSLRATGDNATPIPLTYDNIATASTTTHEQISPYAREELAKNPALAEFMETLEVVWIDRVPYHRPEGWSMTYWGVAKLKDKKGQPNMSLAFNVPPHGSPCAPFLRS